MAAVATSSGFSPSVPGGYQEQLKSWDAIARPCRYWPCDLLSAFMLQMATKGQCVIESMMLGSHDYAIEKLEFARNSGDATLQLLAVSMYGYFDDEPCHAVATLVATAEPH